jgi:mono/diheme cytochrome c family protein
MPVGATFHERSTFHIGVRSGLLWLTLLFWPIWQQALAQEDEIIAGGKLKYQQYCASCHGETGKGDGAMAALMVLKPADLTQLRKQDGNEFPFWRVYRAIDGRENVRGHGTRAMPLWGSIFQEEEGANGRHSQIDVVRGRIWQLVYYLESIQEK